MQFGRTYRWVTMSAILFSILAVSGHVVTVRAQGGSWVFYDVRVFKTMSPYSAVTSETFSKAGGDVEINIDGKALGACPGGSEKMRFTWRFAGDMTSIANGGSFRVSLNAGIASQGGTCAGRNPYSVHSSISAVGSKGMKSPFNDADSGTIDGDRFYRLDDKYYAYAGDEPRNANPGLAISNYKIEPRLPNGYFVITIGTRAGDTVQYVYVYRASGGGGTTGGGEFTIEQNVDRMYGDYKDFDIAGGWESCRDACANDPTCRAFTWVKPGAQTPSARCWLKSTVNAGYANSNCITGVKKY